MIAADLMASAALVTAAQTPFPGLPPNWDQSFPTAMIMPSSVTTVINNTNTQLVCSSKYAANNWRDWFQFPPAANWRTFALGSTTYFHCQSPVRAVRYVLQGGRRYSLLRSPAGVVDLIEVTAGGH